MSNAIHNPRKFFLEFTANGRWLGKVVLSLDESRHASELVYSFFGKEREVPFTGISLQLRDNFMGSINILAIPPSIDRERLLREKAIGTFDQGEMAADIIVRNEVMAFRLMICAENGPVEHELYPAGVVAGGMAVLNDVYIRLNRGEEIRVIEWGTIDW